MKNELTKETILTSLENLIAGFCIFEYNSVTEDLKLIYFNEGLCRMLGYSRTQLVRYTKKLMAYLIPEDGPKVQQGIKDILKDDGSVSVSFRTVTGNGSVRWLEAHSNLSSKEGDVYTLVSIILDVTETQNVNEVLHMQTERMNILSNADHEEIFDYNAKTDVLQLHDSKDLSSTKETIINKYFAEFDASEFHPDDVENYLLSFEKALKSPEHIKLDFRSKRFKENGDYKWYQLNMMSILGVEGYVSRVVGRITDIDTQKKKELEMAARADMDALTNVYNKPAAVENIDNILKKEMQNADKFHALFVLDMDNFKNLNDELGHEAADQILIRVAEALKDYFKGQDIIGRLGGDEFIVFVKNITNINDVMNVAYKLCNEINIKSPNDESSVNITFTIGIALSKQHGETYQNIFEKADKALMKAKADGKNCYRIYNLAEELATELDVAESFPVEIDKKAHTLQEIILNILVSEKDKKRAVYTSLELICKKFGFESAYITKIGMEIDIFEDRVLYNQEGYEIGTESKEHRELRDRCCKSLYQVYHGFTCVNDIGLCDECIQQLMANDNITRVLYYPLVKKETLEGAIVFGNHTDNSEDFTETEYGEMRLVLRLLDAYILQYDMFPSVKKLLPNITTLDNMEQFIYVIDATTYRIAFVNKKVLMETPDVKIGDYCYSILRSSEVPCGDCLIHKMDKNDPFCHFDQESFNYSTRCWMKVTISWLGNPLENNAIMISGFDITDYLTSK